MVIFYIISATEFYLVANFSFLANPLELWKLLECLPRDADYSWRCHSKLQQDRYCSDRYISLQNFVGVTLVSLSGAGRDLEKRTRAIDLKPVLQLLLHPLVLRSGAYRD